LNAHERNSTKLIQQAKKKNIIITILVPQNTKIELITSFIFFMVYGIFYMISLVGFDILGRHHTYCAQVASYLITLNLSSLNNYASFHADASCDRSLSL